MGLSIEMAEVIVIIIMNIIYNYYYSDLNVFLSSALINKNGFFFFLSDFMKGFMDLLTICFIYIFVDHFQTF